SLVNYPHRRRLTRLLNEEEPQPDAAAEAAREPDAWLERRLRVFERALESLEAHHKELERNSRATIAQLEDTVKELNEKIASHGEAGGAEVTELRAALRSAEYRLE